MEILGAWRFNSAPRPFNYRSWRIDMTLATWDQIISEIDYSDLHCDNCRGSLKRYMENQIETGGALRAILENDLFGAMGRLDLDHRDALHSTVKWIYNHLPVVAYGSRKKVDEWLLSDREDWSYTLGYSRRTDNE